MRQAFDRRRRAIVAGSTPSRASSRRRPRARSTSTPTSRRCSAASGAASTPTTTLELADLILEQAEVAVVPGEAFGPSGYLRLSYALGDDELAEGVARLATFFSQA